MKYGNQGKNWDCQNSLFSDILFQGQGQPSVSFALKKNMLAKISMKKATYQDSLLTIQMPLRRSVLSNLFLVNKSLLVFVIRCTIWYHFYNLKNVKNTHGRVLLLVVKLQAESCSFTKSSTPGNTDGAKSHNLSQCSSAIQCSPPHVHQ